MVMGSIYGLMGVCMKVSGEEGRRVVKESFRGLQGRLMKDGRMDGYGTFIGAGGDMYRGWWAADRKRGFGDKLYANGDL